MVAKRRPPRPRFLFSEVGIPVGAILSSRYDDSVRCVVVRDNDVKFDKKVIRFGEATKQMLRRARKAWASKDRAGIQPQTNWKYQGELLSVRYDEKYPRELEVWQEGEEVITEGAPEGARRTIQVNRYERDKKNREKAIKEHGVRCFGCDIKMEEMYGKIARGFIEIHHVKPISTVPERYQPNIDDLVPLCPNCHAVVHLNRKRSPISIAKLKMMIKKKL